MPQFSIVLPTHERADILRECLRHLERQTAAEALEVIVVSDGHDAKTAELFEKFSWHIPVRFHEIAKGQQGVARNRGVEDARAPLCLFIGDDIFLAPDACEQHLRIHNEQRASNVAALGYITWDPLVGITPAMHWLERSGWQFGYPMLEEHAQEFIPERIQHLFTYASHISVPTEIARRFPFPEGAREYGWEDIAWGKDLADAGVRLFYEPAAKALHHHRIDLDASLRRMETLGRTAHHYPAIARVPGGWKRCAYELAALLPTMAGRHRKAFLRGLKASS